MDKYDDIMTPTGDNNKVILTSSNIFNNSSCMFVEYNDVINCPWYVYMLNMIRKDTAKGYFNFIFNKNTEDLEGKLFEWYINRTHLNPFCEVGLSPDINKYFNIHDPNYEEKRLVYLNQFLFSSMDKNPRMFNEEGYLNFTVTLGKIVNLHNLVKRIIIYSESYYKGIEEDIESLYGNNVEYVYGDLVTVLMSDSIPIDSTYVFSDVNKVYALKDANKLNGASILIADRFGYNYNKNNKFKLDMEVFKDDDFILNAFDNVHKLTIV